MSTVLLIAALALVSVWTARLAKVKGRNPWLWGGASFVLGIPTVHLFAVVPLIIIMFLKSPQQQAESIVKTTTCPKCQSISSRNSRFCTKCGWELTRVNAPDIPQEVKPEVEKPIKAPATQTQEPPKVAQAPGQSDAQPAEATTESSAVPVAESASQSESGRSESGQAATTEPGAPEPGTATADAEPAGDPAAEEMPPPVTTYRKPVPVDAPTASSMTERGVRLFNQGRTQESIDQFTKAIALDADYIEAWAKRAEAYALLGRSDQAAEDQRRLDALNASSS